MDDILVFGKTQPEHVAALIKVLSLIETVCITINLEKCKVSKHSIKFLGHVIDDKGISANPEKT